MEKDEAFRKLLGTAQTAYMFISQLLINDLSKKEVKDIQELLANLAEGIFVAGDFLNQDDNHVK